MTWDQYLPLDITYGIVVRMDAGISDSSINPIS